MAATALRAGAFLAGVPRFGAARLAEGNAVTEPAPPRYVSWSGGRVTEDENLQRIPREQLDQLLKSIAKQTGLELKVDRREVDRWRLAEKE